MPALERAFALAQMNHVAVPVAQHLKFDVPRALDQLLHVHVRTAERLLRLGTRGLKRRQQFPCCGPPASRARRRPRKP